MRNFKTSVSALALGAVLSTSLILGGCGKKDKPKKVEITKVETRKVDNAEAEKALKLMGLSESGSGDVKWADRKGESGNYIFSNFEAETKKGNPGVLGTLELKGVHMEGDQPVFDQILFNDFASTEDDGTEVKFKNFTLTEPSPALAAAFSNAFNGDEDAFDDIDGDISFKAMAFSGLNVKSEEGVITLKNINLGQDISEMGYFTLNGLNLDINDDGKKIKMNLDSIDATGVNINKYKGLMKSSMENEGKIDDDAMAQIMSSMNPYDPDFKDFSLKNFTMDVEGMKIKLDSMTGTTKKKGGKVIMSQIMSPLTITPPGSTEDKDMKEFVEGLAELGYDKLEFTWDQNSVLDEKTDTMVVKDSYIELKDGFKLSFDYDMAGYGAAMSKIQGLDGKASKNPMAVMGAMSDFKFNHLRLALEDNSIIDRSFKLAAKQQGGTPDALRQQAKMGLAFLPMMAKDEAQQKVAGDLSAALGKLLDDGGTLTIDFSPEEAIDMATIMQGSMGGQLDVSKLGLTIETK